jgi:general secretion pathway protein D
VKNEQAAVVAGEISSTEQRSLSGIPGVGQFPVLNRAIATNTKEKDSSEFLIVITPHIISLSESPDSMIWMTGIK